MITLDLQHSSGSVPTTSNDITFVDVDCMQIWRLGTQVTNNLPSELPILHPTRSNVLYLFAIPPFFKISRLEEMAKDCSIKFVHLTILNHKFKSALITFQDHFDCDSFYVTYQGEIFDLDFPSIPIILIPVFQVISDIISIFPLVTLNEPENRDYMLPICPICLQIFDPSVSCFNSFATHANISSDSYMNWGSIDCPVCRNVFKQSPNVNFSCCCGETRNLWICMDCGHVGCNREKNRHAIEHYQETKHRFSFLPEKKWIWDYFYDRSADRSFHAPYSDELLNSLKYYRTSIVQNIRSTKLRNGMITHEEVSSFENTRLALLAKLDSIKNQRNSIANDYLECSNIEKDIQILNTKISEIKQHPLMVKKQSLLKEKSEKMKKLASLTKAIANLYDYLENRKDVTNDIVLQMG